MMSETLCTRLGRVGVLFGGRSGERTISLQSGKAVLDALRRVGVQAEPWDPAEMPLESLIEFDRVFIVLHGRGGEDGCIQGALEWLGIPYTGSGVLASALGMNKARTKQVWMAQGLPTPGYRMLDEGFDAQALVRDLGMPLMIKPIHEGSSLGMSKVDRSDQLMSAWQQAFACDRHVMAEQYIQGQEFTVPILAEAALPVIRLQTSHRFYDFEAKYQANDTQYILPCGLALEQEQRLQDLALRAFNAVGAKGWGRIDVMQNEQGDFFLLEINTVPGMTDHSLVPMAARQAGIDFDTLCLRILEGTLS